MFDLIGNADLIGGISNAIRGGQWKDLFNLPPKSRLRKIASDPINAFIFAALVQCMHGDLVLSTMCFAAMWLGAMKGWGDYIGALGGWRTHNLKEWGAIDWAISSLKRYPKLWGWVGLSIRGALWGAVVAVPFALHGLPWVDFIVLGSTMPVWYRLALHWTWHRARSDWQEAGWGLGEIIFGIVFWKGL